MSLRGEHQGSLAGEFVESPMRERDIPVTSSVAVIAASGSTITQPPMFVEASDARGHIAPGGDIYHQHRSLVNLPLVHALIYGGALGIGNNADIVTLGPQGGTGFYRTFFRVKGICPLVPWDPTATIDVTESQWHLNPYMWEAHIEQRTSFDYIQGNVISTVRFLHHPDDIGPAPFNYPSSQVLNRTAQATTTVPLGAFSIDRIVSFSIKASIGGTFKARFVGQFFKDAPTTAWYQSAPTSDITWPNTATQAEIDALQGTGINLGASGTTEFIWRNHAAINPLSLLPPHGPMITPAIGTPELTNYLEIQYIGHRPEATARAEETLDLIPPLLVTTLP